ncbi:LlaJI family restriction endonuclease [Sedimentibacter sp.]|uniref:LlaJI family restriction endonuclease n=1 Tax=Sedimentibacter sp. TaxID=1960295 RepID=UPI0028AA1001|nr:LlaJI family restriction endonuclease [Sedimentibacter sp.]
MISKFVREQKRYSYDNLRDIFECTSEKLVVIIRKLKEYGVLKSVKATNVQSNMSDLINEEIEVSDVQVEDNEHLYVFTFVGVIVVAGYILKCYPKYINNNNAPVNELRKIIKVLEKYSSTEQIIHMYNDSEESSSFNLLSVMIYLLNDYYENGAYTNTQDIIEYNGMGEILWDKTINETFTLLIDNRPYYTEILTRKKVMDDFDYFKRLHECILSIITYELRKSDILDLFEIMPVEISDEELSDFGDNEYIKYRIENELNIQFNTRKQFVLKAIYAYITHNIKLSSTDGFSMFGTNSFNLVWERVCSEVIDNKLYNTLGTLKLPVTLNSIYKYNDTLISIIEKPMWIGKNIEGSTFNKISKDTLIPDLISIYDRDNMFGFIIFDAKYYMIQLESDKELRGQPGIADITKQYLYQLAYKNFIDLHQINEVKNCFLLPTERKDVVDKGYVTMKMFDELGLQNIQLRQLPADKMYEYYINGDMMSISELNL